MTATQESPLTGKTLRNKPFRALRVAAVDRLCDDAAAVTFAVPDEHVEEFAFKPGQSLTVRRTIDGIELRRTYSICSPAGTSPRIGVREVPGGAFSGWLIRDIAAGDELDRSSPV